MRGLESCEQRHLTTACTRPPTRTLSCSAKGLGRRVMPGVRRPRAERNSEDCGARHAQGLSRRQALDRAAAPVAMPDDLSRPLGDAHTRVGREGRAGGGFGRRLPQPTCDAMGRFQFRFLPKVLGGVPAEIPGRRRGRLPKDAR